MRWRCDKCGHITYPSPAPAVDAVLFNDSGEVLLGIRAREPKKGFLNLPGGFISIEETMEQAIDRELLEELDMKPSDHSELVYIGSRAVLYPWGKDITRVIVMFVAGKAHRKNLMTGDDIAAFVWKKVADIRAGEMSYGQRELDIIKIAAAKLKIKL